MFVVPIDEQQQLATERRTLHRDRHQASAAVLERQDESLDDGQAAVLADGAEPRADVEAIAPVLEAVTPELPSLVADQVLGFGAGLTNCPAQECTNGFGRG
jgi:hypothetical protein